MSAISPPTVRRCAATATASGHSWSASRASAAQRLTVGGEIADIARLAVDQAEITAQRRVHLLRIDQVHEMDVVPALEQGTHTALEACRIEKVRHHNHQAGLAGAHGVVRLPLVQPGG